MFERWLLVTITAGYYLEIGGNPAVLKPRRVAVLAQRRDMPYSTISKSNHAKRLVPELSRSEN
jgi:hypothetical protein